MMIVDPGARFDPTPEELQAAAKVQWRATLAAMETEQTCVVEHVGRLETQLAAIDKQIAAATNRHAVTMAEIERANVFDRLDHAKTSRLPAIAEAIALHRKAKP